MYIDLAPYFSYILFLYDIWYIYYSDWHKYLTMEILRQEGLTELQSIEPLKSLEEEEGPIAVIIDVASGSDMPNSEVNMKKESKLSPMNILVTGGAGYIGSVTTSQLVEAGHHVWVYDNLVRGHKEAVHQDAVFIQGDVSDAEKLRQVLKSNQIEAVVHFAAFIEAGESMKPDKAPVYFENNTIGTSILLRTMLETGVKNIVFSSTAAVYGEPKEIPIKEDAELNPTNFYGQSKLFVEDLLRWYHKLGGLRYAALRYFNASGATETLGEDHNPETHLIPLALQAAMGKRPSLQLFGRDWPTKDGTNIRDYIHVTDLAMAHLLALNALKKEGSGRLIYNLGSGGGFSNLEVLEAVGRVIGKKVPYENASRRSGDPAVLIASSQKIQTELGWKPQYADIEKIVETAYRWRKNHPEGYPKSK